MPRLTEIPIEPMRVVVDTREQSPWQFPPYLVSVRRGGLNAGDYALDGDDGFAVERKSLDDYAGSVADATRWERLQNEMERMAAAGYPSRVIIVEGTLDDLFLHRYYGAMPPLLILARTYKLIYNGVAVVFAGDARKAAGVAYGILKCRQEQIERDE